MATSTATIPITVGNAGTTQAQADALRDNGIIDYCKAHNLDIYVTPNTPASGVDATKALAAFRAQVRSHVVKIIQQYRSDQAAVTAASTAAAQAATDLA